MDIVILAGGLGSRFFANGSKVTANFWGIKVIDMLCKTSQKISKNVYVVLRPEKKIKLPEGTNRINQKDGYGTGVAVQSYYEQVAEKNDVLIIPGDVPLIDYDVMQEFLNHKNEADILLGIMKMPEGKEHYGRIIIDKDSNIEKIIEYKHHNEKTEYANTGIILLSQKALPLLKLLEQEKNEEVYLTEIVAIALKEKLKVKPLLLNHEDALGFNTIEEYHNVLSIAQKKWRRKALKSNAIFFDINTVYLSYDTEIEQGAIIEPYVKILPEVKIGKNAVIKSFSSLEKCAVDGQVGPFAHIRSGVIENQAEIGSFVEFNRSIIASGSKAKHLSYLGDVTIEKNVNIGAGCVICNYDGKNKHKTTIEEGAFIGANTTLISPLNIGKNALLAAGSTFTKDVEDEKLAIGRAFQIIKEKKNK